MEPVTMTINDVEYVRKDSFQKKSEKLDGLDYVVIRADRAGVFAGYLKKKTKDEVELTKSRRIFYWDGAASLSQLAMEGVSKPENCKFPCEIEEHTVLGVIEILETTEKARKSIQGVAVWKE